MAQRLEEKIVRYLSSTANCWWTARCIGAVLSHPMGDIEMALEYCCRQGVLRRKRGVGGQYQYQARWAESA